jgi:hypothetical protein
LSKTPYNRLEVWHLRRTRSRLFRPLPLVGSHRLKAVFPPTGRTTRRMAVALNGHLLSFAELRTGNGVVYHNGFQIPSHY